MDTKKIPDGLKKCSKCGEFRGFVLEKELIAKGLYFRTGDPTRSIKINCLCEGPLCSKCGKNRIHRPISNFWDEEQGCAVHVPWCVGFLPICDECR
jgi:hypothetical protein